MPFFPVQVEVLTEGVPNLDFNPINAKCLGTQLVTCTLSVQFQPRYAGLRRGAIRIVMPSNGIIVENVPIYGVGVGAQVGFGLGSTAKIGNGSFQGAALAVDGGDNVYVGGQNVVKVAPNGSESTILNGVSTTALAVNGGGDVLVGDDTAHQLLRFTPGQQNGTLASNIVPQSIAVDGADNVFIADKASPQLLKMPFTGASSILEYARFNGLAVDASGNLFTQNAQDALLEISNNMSPQIIDYLSGTASSISVDATGDLFAVDGSGNLLRIAPGGKPTTVATNVAVASLDGAGNVFYLQTNGALMEAQRSTIPTLTFKAGDSTPQAITIENTGNSTMTISDVSIPASFMYSSGYFEQCSAGQQLQPGQSCTLTVSVRSYLTDPVDAPLSLSYTTTGGSMMTSIPLQTTARPMTLSLSGSWITILNQYGVWVGSIGYYDSQNASVSLPANLDPAPTGTVTFLYNNSPISGCSGMPLSGSSVTCSYFKAESNAPFVIQVQYSGDAKYSPQSTQSVTITPVGGPGSPGGGGGGGGFKRG